MSRVNVSKNQHTFVESMLPDLISVILATFELQNHIYTPRPIKNHSFNKSCHHILKYRNFLKIFFLSWRSVWWLSFSSYLIRVRICWSIWNIKDHQANCKILVWTLCILKHLNLICGKDFQLTKSHSATSLASGVTVLLKVIFLLQFTRYSLKVVIHCSNEE